MQSNIIEVNNLSKAFNDHLLLKDITFSIKRGEIFSLLGSNGSGKSTTIKILTTLIRKYDGNIKIDGLPLKTNGERVRHIISLTGQFVALDLSLTAYQNMKMIAQLRRLKNVNQRITQLLTQFSLLDVKDKQVNNFSGGMKRRLDIAMGLLGDPKIIFLDEPTTGIDPQNRIAMWDIIKELSAQGVTIFLTTQYLEEAEALADTVAILDKGVISDIGSVSELKNKYGAGTLEQIFLSIVKNNQGGQLNA